MTLPVLIERNALLAAKLTWFSQ